MEDLYQKRHGLSGVPVITGTSGEDGTGGNHVYFGYINDFFDVVDVSADYIVRTATGDGDIRYTGSFAREEDTPVDDVSGRYLDITSDPEFPHRYSVSYPDGVTSSREYVKVDVADIGLDASGNSSPWNLSYEQNERFCFNSSFYTADGSLWPEYQYNYFDTLVPEDREHHMMLKQIYPYVDFDGLYDGNPKNPMLMMPGNYALSKSVRGVFDLFSITDADENIYQFAYTPKTTYYNGDIYARFNDSSLHSINNPTIEQILGNIRRDSSVDYIKLGQSLSESVKIPDKLKEEIKAGDVIYFYTNEEKFENNHEVQYMAVITDSLERCTYQQLIDNAVLHNPYTFKFTSKATASGEEYVYSTTPAVAGYYKETNTSDSSCVQEYGRNMVNMLNCLGSDVALQVGTLADKDQDDSDVLKLLAAENDAFTYSFDIKAKNVKNGQLVILTEDKTGTNKKPMLKIANAYFRKNNIGNIETELALTPAELVVDENGVIHTPDDSDIDVTTGRISLVASEYISSSVKQWMIGAVVQTYKSDGSRTAYSTDSQAASDDDGIFHRYEWNQNSENLEFTLEKTFGDNTVHEISIWASVPGSYRKYSGTLTATWDALIGQYRLSSTAIEPEDDDMKDKTRAKFDVASISSDLCENIPVKITIPCDKPEGQMYKVFINTSEIAPGGSYGDTNSWFSAEWVDDVVSEDGKWRTITLNFSMKSNLPSICGDFDYAADYNASPGSISTVVDGCDLFNAIMKGEKTSTDSRSVNVAINYEFEDSRHTDFVRVIQPGYTDPRKIPDVKITLPNDIRSLEDSNRSSLGVQANMFQFFVDIEISDFDKSIWGSFVPESNITLDMTIKNTPYDKEFADKYSIPNPRDTRSLHVNTVNPEIDLAASANNFVSFKTYVMEPLDGSPYGKTQRQLDEYNNKAMERHLIAASDDINIYDSGSVIPVHGNSVDMTPEIFRNPDERRDGIQDNIVIELNDLRFGDVSNGKFRFRVVTEMSNPVFSMLFFRFYVSDLTVKYTYNNQIRSFYVGQKNMKPDMQTYSGNYKYASETLRAFLCPVSMTAIPEEDKVDPVSPAIMMTGSKQQISLKTGAYVPLSVIEENKTITESQKVHKYVGQGQSLGWFNFSLKKKYFQDDVTKMSFTPIRPESMKDIITEDTLMTDDKFKEISSTDNTTGYMTVVYDSAPSILATRKREDMLSFYYNAILYDAYGYSQKNNRKPVSTEQTGTIDVRDASLESAVTFWNRWYQDNRTASSDDLFRGVVAAYGNGYVYLEQGNDENLQTISEQNDVYTLDDTKKLSDETIECSTEMGYNTTKSASQPDRFISAPGSDAWFRTLLYQCQWQYPKHYTDDVTSVRYVNMYDLVTPGEYKNDSNLKIPYNIAYSLYPRCAYDTDNDMAIIFMLRCPSVVTENKYRMVKEDLRVYVEDYQPLDNEKLSPAD